MTTENANKPPSSLSLLASLVDRPSTTLAEILTRPRGRWVLPTLLAVLSIVASAVVTAPYLAIAVKAQMATVLSRLTPEQLAQMPQQMTSFQSPAFIGVTTALTGILALIVGYLVRAAVLYFAALVTGGEVQFNRYLAAMPWLGLPFVLEAIVQTAYVLANKQLLVNQGLSYLVSSGKPATDAGNWAYAALGTITVFWLWHLLLTFKLYRGGSKFSGGTAFILTLVYALLTVTVRIGSGVLTRLVSPSG